jgi:hypothetical protein
VKLHFLDAFLWAAGPVFNAALLYVLFRRGRARKFPLLAVWGFFTIFSALALFLIYRSASSHTYVIAYWSVETLDAILQLAVVAEVARIVFSPIAGWIPLHRPQFLILISAAIAGSFAMIWWIHPSTLTRAGAWEIRGELFTSLLISEMFTGVLLASQKFGLHWRSHVMSIGYGLMVWAVTTIAIGILHGYWGMDSHYVAIEYIRMVVYLSILGYWIVALWRDEPQKGLLPPEIQDAFLQVADRVSYDLAEVLGTREKESH